MKTFRYQDSAGESLELEWERKGERLVAGELELELVGDRVRVEDNQLPFCVSRQGDDISVWLDGELFTFTAENASRRRNQDDSGPGGDQLVSSMPGKILEIRCQVGEQVEKDQILVVMESMKMELTLGSPRAGKVEKVPVAVEAMVAQGSLLIQLEAEQ